MNRKNQLFSFTGLVALGIAVIGGESSAVYGQSATLQKVEINGALIPGGTVGYQATVRATGTGTVTLVGRVRSAGDLWADFDLIEQTIEQGVTTFSSSTVSIPSSFTGNARVMVVATFNEARIGRVRLPFTVTAPVETTVYDAGFNASVALSGRFVSTSGMAKPFTWTWVQADGEDYKQVEIVAANKRNASFTTLPIENFVNLGFDKHEPFGVVGLDAHQVAMSTYTFVVTVTDGKLTRSGKVTVTSGSMAPGLPVVPVGVNAYLKTAGEDEGEITALTENGYNWTIISKPPHSTATIQQPNSRTPYIRPDVEGNYVIQDGKLGTNITLIASTYTGGEFCAICHGPGNNVGLRDIVTPWSGTGHATFMKRGLDGELGQYYNQNCLSCHAVGYNPAPAANNNGLDDVARLIGWTFPAEKKPGTFDAQPFQIKAMANVQCESCHGPGSRHPGANSVTLNTAMCATCHQDGHFHTRVEQWERSAHALPYEHVSEEEGTSGTCARCHAPTGFVDVGKRMAYLGQDIVTASRTNNYATGIGKLSCQTCHDPHHGFDNPDRKQLRVYDQVVLGNPAAAGHVVLQNQGSSATCMYCHNTRRFPYQISAGNPQYRGTRSGVISGPHESTASEIFSGLAGIEYNATMGNTFHTYAANCVMCHMYPNPAATTAGHNKVGDHTFSMSYMDGDTKVENLDTCNQCHAGAFTVDKFDFKSLAAKDWDGNGEVSGVQTETQGLLDRVRTLLETSGVQSIQNEAGFYTGFRTNGLSADAVIRDAQFKAAWNWMMINRDGSKGVHNPLYTIRLLQNTFTDLSTNYHGDASRTLTNEFPSAVLR